MYNNHAYINVAIYSLATMFVSSCTLCRHRFSYVKLIFSIIHYERRRISYGDAPNIQIMRQSVTQLKIPTPWRLLFDELWFARLRIAWLA